MDRILLDVTSGTLSERVEIPVDVICKHDWRLLIKWDRDKTRSPTVLLDRVRRIVDLKQLESMFSRSKKRWWTYDCSWESLVALIAVREGN